MLLHAGLTLGAGCCTGWLPFEADEGAAGESESIGGQHHDGGVLAHGNDVTGSEREAQTVVEHPMRDPDRLGTSRSSSKKASGHARNDVRERRRAHLVEQNTERLPCFARDSSILLIVVTASQTRVPTAVSPSRA